MSASGLCWFEVQCGWGCVSYSFTYKLLCVCVLVASVRMFMYLCSNRLYSVGRFNCVIYHRFSLIFFSLYTSAVRHTHGTQVLCCANHASNGRRLLSTIYMVVTLENIFIGFFNYAKYPIVHSNVARMNDGDEDVSTVVGKLYI